MPSPNGEVTHVVVVPCDPSKREQITHLDLPGIGHVGITTSGTPPRQYSRQGSPLYSLTRSLEPHLLHLLADTLTSYALRIASQSAKPLIPPERYNSPLPRSVTAAFTSKNPSLLRPSTPGPASTGEPPLSKNKSFTSLRPEGERPGPGGEDRGLSGLLGRRKAPKSPTVLETNESAVELGEGKEVERDGYGQWSGIRISHDGEGIGWTDEAVDVSLPYSLSHPPWHSTESSRSLLATVTSSMSRPASL